MGQFEKLETKERFKEIIESNTLVFVDFYADWCGPCRIIQPKLEDLAGKYTDIVFVKINVDAFDESTIDEYKISAMPTFLCFIKGVRKAELDVIGASELKVKESLDKMLEEKPVENKPAEDKPAEDKPAEDKPAEEES